MDEFKALLTPSILFWLLCCIFVIFSDPKRRKKFFYYSGIHLICNKFYPIDRTKLPSGFIWAFSIYIALFGIASQRYENRVDIIENRINGIYSQISKDMIIAFNRISYVQNMECPYKPTLFNPISIVQSFLPVSNKKSHQEYFFGLLPLKGVRYEDGVEQLKELVEDYARKTEAIEEKLIKDKNAERWLKDITKLRLENEQIIGVLSDVNFEGVHLEYADLKGAHLEGTNLMAAFLENAKLMSAHLEHARLVGAHMEYAILNHAHLEYADLVFAHLENSILEYAHLENASLSMAHLNNAILIGAHLNNASLDFADLDNACLCKADLKSVTGLNSEQLSKAISLYGVKNFDLKLEKEIKTKYPHLLEPNYKFAACNEKNKGKTFLPPGTVSDVQKYHK